jgi:hypothetical protein
VQGLDVVDGRVERRDPGGILPAPVFPVSLHRRQTVVATPQIGRDAVGAPLHGRGQLPSHGGGGPEGVARDPEARDLVQLAPQLASGRRDLLVPQLERAFELSEFVSGALDGARLFGDARGQGAGLRDAPDARHVAEPDRRGQDRKDAECDNSCTRTIPSDGHVGPAFH